MYQTKPEEEKRAELIDRLWRRDALIARAVERAEWRFESGVLLLDYQDPAFSAWAKVLTDPKQKPRLEAIAKQVGIAVQVLS